MRECGESYDSERFRELVQEMSASAHRASMCRTPPAEYGLELAKGALAAALLVVVLALVPGLNFGKMFARALLPGSI